MANRMTWRAHQAAAYVSEPVEVAQWDRLLHKLGLSEREALDAIVRDGDAGRSIRRFVQESRRDHFVPEDVLLALKPEVMDHYLLEAPE
jgi:hypothetical protein